MRIFIFTFISCFCFGTAFIGDASAYQATIVQVTDGDTLIVKPEKGRGGSSSLEEQEYTIRLYGIDCPEVRQDYGKATTRLTRIFVGQQVDVQIMYTDSYGRSVAVLLLNDGSSLQEHLLRSGAAWVYSKYCKTGLCNNWKSLQHEAQVKRIGLWASELPVPPWLWRKYNK